MKLIMISVYTGFPGSPSMRREWIEIGIPGLTLNHISSLPPCGGSGLKFWIRLVLMVLAWSPSMRREWIEMHRLSKSMGNRFGLPPCGGSGLKFAILRMVGRSERSPSMRREWIEIQKLAIISGHSLSPSMRREWIEMPRSVRTPRSDAGLPPCGGSGLKCSRSFEIYRRIRSPSMRREWIEISESERQQLIIESPSMRREWIEICSCAMVPGSPVVSLHAEGVD